MPDRKLEADIASIILRYRDDPTLAVKTILGLQPIKDGLFLLSQREAWRSRGAESSDGR